LLSYLLFERGFTREMIQLGYDDTVARGAEIRDFLRLPHMRQFRTTKGTGQWPVAKTATT
jgi:hypothetical protein